MSTENEKRLAVMHQSINRPNLLMGGDRELVLFAAMLAGILAFALMTWWGIVLGALLWPSAVVVLREMAKADPHMRDVYVRHIRYATYYPAKSHRLEAGATTPSRW